MCSVAGGRPPSETRPEKATTQGRSVHRSDGQETRRNTRRAPSGGVGVASERKARTPIEQIGVSRATDQARQCSGVALLRRHLFEKHSRRLHDGHHGDGARGVSRTMGIIRQASG